MRDKMGSRPIPPIPGMTCAGPRPKNRPGSSSQARGAPESRYSQAIGPNDTDSLHEPSRWRGAEASAAREGSREAGGATVALAGDLVAAVDADVDARDLHPSASLGVALQRERDARAEREDVRPHRVELIFRDLDPLHPAAPQEFGEP